MIKILTVRTGFNEELVDITAKVSAAVAESGVKDGLACVFTPHTTAAVTINENADPDVRSDIILGLKSMRIESADYAHIEGNSAAHIKSSLVGCSEIVIIDKGRLLLGTWQGIYLCEFDGPRTREVYVKII
ncbi:MAG: YjbQ family protein [Spirochaetes bacterium]|nr:YjbQ family protein [Spirochaetota bacterium]